MSIERRHVHYRGHVQGVGFRYSTRQIADGFAVAGFVRNLPDGAVELIAEGEAAELERFLNAVGERLANYIRDRRIHVGPANGEFKEFEIRH